MLEATKDELVLLSIEKHVIVGCNHETHVAQKTIATAVHKLKNILHKYTIIIIIIIIIIIANRG